MTSPLPDTLEVQPDRGIIGIYGDHVDTFTPRLPPPPDGGILESNDTESYLHTAQTLAPVTLHFTHPPADSTHQPLGEATLDIITGRLVISEITRNAHGPFETPHGPGIYRITVFADPQQRHAVAQRISSLIEETTTAEVLQRALEEHRGTEHYWIRLARIADSAAEDDE